MDSSILQPTTLAIFQAVGFHYINNNPFWGCKKEMWMDKRNVEKNSGRIPPSFKGKYSNQGHVVCDDSSFCYHPKNQLNIYIASFLSERIIEFISGFAHLVHVSFLCTRTCKRDQKRKQKSKNPEEIQRNHILKKSVKKLENKKPKEIHEEETIS
jgi:hypothetical protein